MFRPQTVILQASSIKYLAGTVHQLYYGLNRYISLQFDTCCSNNYTQFLLGIFNYRSEDDPLRSKHVARLKL